MTKHFYRDMELLHREILALSALVEEMIDDAARSLLERDADLARQVIRTDQQVDDREVYIEDYCLKMLALHQPVAVDLRRIATVMKVDNDLERIADLAVNVAERAESLTQFPAFPIPAEVNQIVARSTEMVRGAMDAFVNLDTEQARRVREGDDVVDRLNAEIIDELTDLMHGNSQMITPAMHCFSAVRHIERIADHATNIAEDVIYLVEGDIVRHRSPGSSQSVSSFRPAE
ncbi:MAG: phosphate signaling complex protein PhoU [Planctomycetales bacterium]|nr:phosphate signaling complex protein PhoU [Planctomycetales bacterium]